MVNKEVVINGKGKLYQMGFGLRFSPIASKTAPKEIPILFH